MFSDQKCCGPLLQSVHALNILCVYFTSSTDPRAVEQVTMRVEGRIRTFLALLSLLINYGGCAECSTIWSEIKFQRVITKSFAITSLISLRSKLHSTKCNYQFIICILKSTNCNISFYTKHVQIC